MGARQRCEVDDRRHLVKTIELSLQFAALQASHAMILITAHKIVAFLLYGGDDHFLFACQRRQCSAVQVQVMVNGCEKEAGVRGLC